MNNDPLHILLVDDDEGDRILFKEAFAELKIKTIVRTLNDGIQLMKWLCVKYIRLPDFLFLDLNMPRKNGIECLKEIRNNERLKEIFIAIYSTSNNEKDLEESFTSGANIYIRKPNNFNTLKEVLEKAVFTGHLFQDKTLKRDNFLLKL